MMRFLIILALVLQVTFPTARCVVLQQCPAWLVCDADSQCTTAPCITECCDTPVMTCCAMACTPGCEDQTSTPDAPPTCPLQGDCEMCCPIICRFDPVQAITGSNSGHPSPTSPTDSALSALLALAPSYPIITTALGADRPPIPIGDLPPPVSRVLRPAICVWTI